MKGVYFVTGIDTNIGKSIATGWLARELAGKGVSVITQKMVQTGNEGYSEDIECHRKIMGIPYTDEDKSLLTAPVIFTYPASPHLAARIDGKEIDIEKITASTRTLAERYDIVLLEGAGGPMVPLRSDLLTIDYVAEQNYPTVLVTSGRLGSINHTVLCFEALLARKMSLHTVVYNRYPSTDTRIEEDTLQLLRYYMARYFPQAVLLEMPELNI